jgi:hypothetical protein
MTYNTRVPGFSDIGRTREGPRFSITFALYVKKIFISRVCKCVNTERVYNVQGKKYIHQYVKPCEENPRYTFLTIKSSLRSHIMGSYFHFW